MLLSFLPIALAPPKKKTPPSDFITYLSVTRRMIYGGFTVLDFVVLARNPTVFRVRRCSPKESDQYRSQRPRTITSVRGHRIQFRAIIFFLMFYYSSLEAQPRYRLATRFFFHSHHYDSLCSYCFSTCTIKSSHNC